MKLKLMTLLMINILMLSACSSIDETESDAIASATESEYELPADLIRSDSTVIDDSATEKTITSQESYQLGTYIKISIYADTEVPGAIFDELFFRIDQYEQEISTSIETSEINAVNEAAGDHPVEVTDDIWELVQKGIRYGDLSGGRFDITIEPLVKEWGIGTDSAHVPTVDEIDAAKALVDYTKLEMDETDQTLYLPEAGMGIDLGAIAKGYIADRIKDVILERGYEHAIINLGGNVLTVGTKPNSDAWSVGVRDPEGGQSDLVGVLSLQDNAIVSSGVYERYFEEDGVRYHHILNPFTGYPEQNELLSISIVTSKSVDGDGLSTSLFVMGLDEAFAYAESQEDFDALFVTSDHKIYYTSGLDDKFTLTNTVYDEIGDFQ